MVLKATLRAGGRSAGKKVTKKKRPVKKETAQQKTERLIKLDSDIKKVKALREKELKRIRAEKAKVKKKASTQRGMVGSGARSAPGKGAKNPRAKDAEPMRAMSDDLTAKDAVRKGQKGKITTGKDAPMHKQLQTKAQKNRVAKYLELKKKQRDGTLTAEDKRWLKSDAAYEAERLRRSGQGSRNKRADSPSKAGRKTAAQRKRSLDLPPLKGEKKTVRTKDDMGDPSTGEVTSKTTANRAAALARSADRQAKIAADRRKDKRTRARNVREMKRRK
tara:strand:- start:116 stop:943 length:828 start_codon:yes stop_codon:yes gene_type:complete